MQTYFSQGKVAFKNAINIGQTSNNQHQFNPSLEQAAIEYGASCILFAMIGGVPETSKSVRSEAGDDATLPYKGRSSTSNLLKDCFGILMKMGIELTLILGAGETLVSSEIHLLCLTKAMKIVVWCLFSSVGLITLQKEQLLRADDECRWARKWYAQCLDEVKMLQYLDLDPRFDKIVETLHI